MNQIAGRLEAIPTVKLEAIPYESELTWELNNISCRTNGGELEFTMRRAIYVQGLGFGDQETTLFTYLKTITL